MVSATDILQKKNLANHRHRVCQVLLKNEEKDIIAVCREPSLRRGQFGRFPDVAGVGEHGCYCLAGKPVGWVQGLSWFERPV
jgi:hypothetical protein